MKSLRFLLPLLIACGGTQEASTTAGAGGGGGGGASKPAQAGDVSIEVPTFQLTGVVFEPEALGRPGIPTSPPKKKATVEALRKAIDQAKTPVLKQAYAVGLASMLYLEGKQKPDQEKALMEDARKVLRDVIAAVGDKVDETTLLFLGSYELYFDDYAAAEKAWGQLTNQVTATKDKQLLKDVPYFRTWWTYSLLKQFKNAEALAVVKDTPSSEKTPELAYVTAWAKWRTNDDAGAWQAIVAASKGWQGRRDAIDRDLFLFAARTKVPFTEASQALFTIFNAKQNAPRYELLAKLGLQGYGFAGRWVDGVTAIDKAFEVIGKEAPPNDVPVLRYSQADYSVRLDNPEQTAKYALMALDALPACGAKCSEKDKADLVAAVAGIARVFHFLYATANDERYYEPANKLYLKTIPMITDATTRGERNKDAITLQTTKKQSKPGTGTHDKDAVRVVMERHNQEVQACYEAGLAANPKIGGTLTLNLESDQTGVIKGVASEPKAGMEGMAAVAGCAAERAKAWKLPARGTAGSTRIKLSYALAAKK